MPDRIHEALALSRSIALCGERWSAEAEQVFAAAAADLRALRAEVQQLRAAPTAGEFYARCLAEAREVYAPEGVRIFMQGANVNLDGRSPIDAIFAGDGDLVLTLLRQMTEGTPS